VAFLLPAVLASGERAWAEDADASAAAPARPTILFDAMPGHYRLGPAALSLGMSAIQQIDGFEIVRREVTALRDATRRSAAVTAWTDDGAISLFKQDGDQRGAFEFRTGLLPMLTTAASKIYAACLPLNRTKHLIDKEWGTVFGGKPDADKFREDARRELGRRHFATLIRPTSASMCRSRHRSQIGTAMCDSR
jgi:DNA-binding IclR family transcriptional regulator